jgi:hypothetical protein
MGSAISRLVLTVEGLLLMAIGMVGLTAAGNSPLLPDGALTNTGLLVVGMAVLGAAQRPGPRRVVAWVQAIGVTAKLVSAAAGNPVELPWHAGPSALVAALLLGVAALSLSGSEAEDGPSRRR